MASTRGSLAGINIIYLRLMTPNWGLPGLNGLINLSISCKVRLESATTVSPNYMEELRQSVAGLEPCLNSEKGKCSGIINGIDSDVWNPATDPHLLKNCDQKQVKKAARLLTKLSWLANLALILKTSWSALLAGWWMKRRQDLLPEAISQSVYQYGGKPFALDQSLCRAPPGLIWTRH